MSKPIKVIDVAVAVIHYQDQYLLGYRQAHQHRGNRYEFVGGKIEANESPKQGLIREVLEEIGCDLANNPIINMGIIRHDYFDNEKLDKSVALHIFNIAVTQAQFDSLQHDIGTEGQLITWVSKADLLAKKYPLPEANVRILDWLTLPNTIFISQSLDKFDTNEDWLNFYTKTLPHNANFYIRPQTDSQTHFSLTQALLQQRPDILPLIQWQVYQDFAKAFDFSNAIIHLNHQQLIGLDLANLPKELRYFFSCHDQNSLSKLNGLAKTHTVMGCFLSPVLATPTHPEQSGMGWQAFAELARLSDVPVFALGGVSADDLPTAWQCGAVGVAGIRLIDGFS
ncbi:MULTISPECIES: NUDIX domain-containing protein [unclassified Moraxella]|uniref:NUDIX domain-containing protein n=1 Tax=unclassified Moraxella TaxID=2685852 RepID=UPI003AF6697D